MKMDDSSNKDVEALTWEGDGGSTDVLLWARDQDGMGDIGPDGLDSSLGDMDGPSIERDISSGVHDDIEDTSSSGRGEGTLSVRSERRQTQYETEENNDHSGTAGISGTTTIDGDGAADGGEMVDVDTIIDRLRSNTSGRLRRSSLKEYVQILRRFDRFSSLKGKTKKDLTGKRGRRLIMDFMKAEYAPRSWRYRLAGLKTIYISGFGYNSYDWPIEPRRDLPRLPPARPERTPPDDVVKVWADHFRNKETDLEHRLIGLLVLQLGWSPSDVISLDVQEIEMRDGRPHAISRERLKSRTNIIAWLNPELAEALLNYLKTRSPSGRLFNMVPESINRRWKRMAKRTGYPRLRPKQVRHWVASMCRRAGLSKAASGALMGHTSTSGGAMRDWYDQPTPEDLLAEQAERLPHGPLGLLIPPRVEVVVREGEILALWKDYTEGRMSTMEFAARAEALRMDNILVK